jgi:hypothetical protein
MFPDSIPESFRLEELFMRQVCGQRTKHLM